MPRCAPCAKPLHPESTTMLPLGNDPRGSIVESNSVRLHLFPSHNDRNGEHEEECQADP